jgi:hypothetical protein
LLYFNAEAILSKICFYQSKILQPEPDTSTSRLSGIMKGKTKLANLTKQALRSDQFNSSFIIHHSSFIIHHSSFIIHHSFNLPPSGTIRQTGLRRAQFAGRAVLERRETKRYYPLYPSCFSHTFPPVGPAFRVLQIWQRINQKESAPEGRGAFFV